MKSCLLGWGMVLACATARGQAPADVSVCEVINHPAKWNGKVVRMKGVVQASFDSLLVKGDTCDSVLWLSYPAGTRAKSGPAAVLTLQLASNSAGTPGKARPAVALEKNADWNAFDTLLAAKVKTPGMCLGCVKNDVMATLIGRVDGVDDAGLVRDGAGKVTGLDGFGNLNAYTVRLVLTGVAGPVAQEVDYSKAPKVKDDTAGGGEKDYNGSTRKAEASFAKGSDPVAQIERALNAYGAAGQDNGVTVGFGGVADVPAGEGTKAAKASPDGLILNVVFDADKLKGDALSRASVHEGSLVASERESSVPTFIKAEQVAWQTALVTTIGARQKTLMLPGGFVLWDADWPVAEQSADAGDGITGFLTVHEHAPR